MNMPLHLAIGIFDGVHRGHQYILQGALKAVKQWGGRVGVLTFHPHPKRVLGLPNAPQMIYPIQQRYWLLRRFGCQYVFVKKFSNDWSRFSPDRFFVFLKRFFPQLKTLHVGEDFHFGYQRQGDVDTLSELCRADRSVQACIYPHLMENGHRICSTQIRDMLQSASIKIVNQLLGMPYHCIGFIKESIFYHHCELKIKDGTYHCKLKNKLGLQEVVVEVKDGIIYLFTQPNACFRRRACLLEFQSEM